MIFVSSILIYPSKNISYIDSLYFGTSICTQGGLDPVNLNILNTWQQFVLYFIPMFTNPIFINTIVVFVRLFYFEREFKDIRARSKEQSRYRRNFTREMTLASGVDPDQNLFQRIKRTFTHENTHNHLGKRYPTGRLQLLSQRTRSHSIYTNENKSLDNRRDLEYGYRIPTYSRSEGNPVVINPAYNDDKINSQNGIFLESNSNLAPPPLHERAISFSASAHRPSELKNHALSHNNNDDDKNKQNPSFAPAMSERDIRFADLPRPPKPSTSKLPPRSVRQNSIHASDIARSIMTLERRDREARAAREAQEYANSFSRDEDGDAPLVIKTVQEVEQEEEERQRRRHQQQQQHQREQRHQHQRHHQHQREQRHQHQQHHQQNQLSQQYKQQKPHSFNRWDFRHKRQPDSEILDTKQKLHNSRMSLASFLNTISTDKTACSDNTDNVSSRSGFNPGNANNGEEHDYEQDRVYNPERDHSVSDSSLSDDDDKYKKASEISLFKRAANSTNNTLFVDEHDQTSSFNTGTGISSNDTNTSKKKDDTEADTDPNECAVDDDDDDDEEGGNGNSDIKKNITEIAENVKKPLLRIVIPNTPKPSAVRSAVEESSKTRSVSISEPEKPNRSKGRSSSHSANISSISSSLISHTFSKKSRRPSSSPQPPSFLRRFSFGSNSADASSSGFKHLLGVNSFPRARARSTQCDDIDEVLDNESMCKTAQETGEKEGEEKDTDVKLPTTTIFKNFSFGSGSSKPRANSTATTTEKAISSDPASETRRVSFPKHEERPKHRRTKSHNMLINFARRHSTASSISDNDENILDMLKNSTVLKLKEKARAKTLDTTKIKESNKMERSKSLDKMLTERKLKNAGFIHEKVQEVEHNDDEADGNYRPPGLSYPDMSFPRSATSESHGDLDFQDLSRVMSSNYLSYQPMVEGNSVFVNLSDEQKEELGGVEYRALKILAKILVGYFIGWHAVAVILLLPWGVTSVKHSEAFNSQGFSPVWWGFFTAASSFNNLGLTLSPDSMASFSTSIYILIFVPFFMIIGNTGFPVFLRFIIWIMFKIAQPYGRMRETLGFLLDHPRRCFTLLFPSGPTWWLFGVLVALNILDTVLFLVLDLGKGSSVQAIPVGYRIMSGFFQSVATRTTGFSILTITDLHPAVIVSYTIMMYINIFPVAMSVRHTNVYEEQTLGLYSPPTKANFKGEDGDSDNEDENDPVESERSKNFTEVTTHLMRQLSYDLWFMFIALFIICISEQGKTINAGENIPIFNILFEVTSAYGTVGLSTGYPGVDMSLSSQFSVIGKLVIIVLLYRGRQRSLPYAIDRAIILPTHKMLANDRKQELVVRNRTISRMPTMSTNNRVGMNRPIYSMASGYSTTTSLNSRRPWNQNSNMKRHDAIGTARSMGSMSTRNNGNTYEHTYEDTYDRQYSSTQGSLDSLPRLHRTVSFGKSSNKQEYLEHPTTSSRTFRTEPCFESATEHDTQGISHDHNEHPKECNH